MITINTIEIDVLTSIISIKGELSPGSDGNNEAKKMKQAVENLPKEKTRIILNLLDLIYTFGDYFNGFLFIPLYKRQIKFNVVAHGETSEALNHLIEKNGINKILNIVIYDNAEDAVLALTE